MVRRETTRLKTERKQKAREEKPGSCISLGGGEDNKKTNQGSVWTREGRQGLLRQQHLPGQRQRQLMQLWLRLLVQGLPLDQTLQELVSDASLLSSSPPPIFIAFSFLVPYSSKRMPRLHMGIFVFEKEGIIKRLRSRNAYTSGEP